MLATESTFTLTRVIIKSYGLKRAACTEHVPSNGLQENFLGISLAITVVPRF